MQLKIRLLIKYKNFIKKQKQLLKTIVNEYKIDKNKFDLFVETVKPAETEALLNSFTYREKVHTYGEERHLIDNIISNFLNKKPNDFIVKKAEESWVLKLKH